jgi:hypothetical protein
LMNLIISVECPRFEIFSNLLLLSVYNSSKKSLPLRREGGGGACETCFHHLLRGRSKVCFGLASWLWLLSQ